MNIEVTVVAVLKDEDWGFSSILDGRPLNEETIIEIRELLDEDLTVILEDGIFTIKEAPKQLF